MHCAALPWVGQTHQVRWIDTGSELPGFDNHVYLSEPAVIEACRVFGMPSPEEYRQAREYISELEQRVAEQTAALESADRRLRSIEILESEGFRARRRPGRPPKQEEQVT